MSHDPESSGPLTEEQFKEMSTHRLAGEPVSTILTDIIWFQGVLKNTSKGDPAYKHFYSELVSSERYVHLKTRYKDFGVASTINLSQKFDT